MTTINVKQFNTASFVLNEDMNDWNCSHPDAYIEAACCSTVGSSGYIECGCGGIDGVICPAVDCDGITDHDAERLFEEL